MKPNKTSSTTKLSYLKLFVNIWNTFNQVIGLNRRTLNKKRYICSWIKHDTTCKDSLLPFVHVSHHNAFINKNTWKNSIGKKSQDDYWKALWTSEWLCYEYLNLTVRKFCQTFHILVKADKAAARSIKVTTCHHGCPVTVCSLRQ